MDNRFYRSALNNGFDSHGMKLGTILGRGWFWFRRGGCRVVYREGSGAGGGVLAGVLGSGERRFCMPSWLVHRPGRRFVYRVCSVNGWGAAEKNVRGQLQLEAGIDGRVISRCERVFGLQVRVGSAGAQIVWYFAGSAGRSLPEKFCVYGDNGSGVIDWQECLGEVMFAGRRYYSVDVDLDGPGRYRWAVRSQGKEAGDYADAFVEADVGAGDGCSSYIVDIRNV